MSKLAKIVKAGAVAGACGLGLCAIERKFKVSQRLAGFAHNVEIGPFPGTRAYSFFASRQMRALYSTIADEIITEKEFNRMLDIGTGTGYLPIEISIRNPEASVYGMDESDSMTRVADANRLAMQVGKNVEFITGSPSDIPFPGRFFDLVVCINVLHHWKHPDAVFDEVYHTLVPGGQFWIYDYRSDVSQASWDKLRSSLPFHLRLPFAVGPVASANAAYDKPSIKKLVSKSNLELLSINDRTYEIFGFSMPVFNVIKLRKPE
jgi:ubiquinone/menaquinone biosynthesis C-methylase UbiE